MMWKRYASEIADAIERMVLGLSTIVDILYRIFVFAVLLITCPIWIIPYIIRRKNVPQNRQEADKKSENNTDTSKS